MEYNREYWQPRIATNPNRFRKLNESNDYVELINEPEAITQAGTAFTAARLNNMETGITGAVAGVNEIQGVVDFTEKLNAFAGLSQAPRQWFGMTTLGDDVYACVNFGDIYKQTNGTGDFIALGQTPRQWSGMTTLGSDVYACVYNGDIYKQTNGTGDFIALGQAPRNWYGMTTLGSDVYACVAGGDIYKQTNGAGDFIALGQTPRQWSGMTTLGSDVYACVAGGDIYKQTNGTGDFIALGQTPRQWSGMTTLGSDVYACVYNGDIYKQTNGTGDFIALGQTIRNWFGMTTLGSNVYACSCGGDIYIATILTGNTFRASSSFTLPAMPDGARKRILNTHETTAITVTAYSGTTIEGQATMTLSAGHEVELELIGTDWRVFVLSQSATPEAQSFNISNDTQVIDSAYIGGRVLYRRITAYNGNPITITPPSGATFEGLASLSLYGQYSFVELERISSTVFAIKDRVDKYNIIPVLQFGGASVGITYSGQSGSVAIKGRMCVVTGLIRTTSKGTSVGALTVKLTDIHPAVAVVVASLALVGVVYNGQYAGYLQGDTIYFENTNLSGTNSGLTNVNANDAATYRVTATYFI